MVNEAVNIGFDLPWGEKARTAFHVSPADPLPATYKRPAPACGACPQLGSVVRTGNRGLKAT
jgi:hypothetical protein